MAIDPSILATNGPANAIQRLAFESTLEDDQSIKVYLRIRPHDDCADSEKISYTISGTSFQLSGLKSSTVKSFSFSHVFSDQTKQGDIYDTSVKDLVSNFIEGNNSTMMTYGTSGAGKTHTLLGSVRSPGIVPRALYNIFKVLPMSPVTELLKPNDNLEVEQLSPQLITKEQKNKLQLLKLCDVKKRRSLYSYSSMQDLLNENKEPENLSGHSQYILWVSFAEIYNECVYDLLDTTPIKIGQTRPKLKLYENKYSSYYIKNLSKIPIRNGEEAYKILRYGQRNLQYAATKINMSSSRSHCIFTLYLVKLENDTATLSHFNFCDLAGSERVVNTQHTGNRLKETQSINTTLHVLGRCLKIIQENQSIESHKRTLVPYRESKLTKLFHRALMGEERLSLLVNVHPKQIFFEETLNTLNFASIAQDIILNKEFCNRKSRVRVSGFENVLSSTVCDDIIEIASDNESMDSDDTLDYSKEELHDLLQEQSAKIAELQLELDKKNEESENKVKDLVSKFSDILKNSQRRYEQQISDLKEKYEKQISNMAQSLEENVEENDDSIESDIELIEDN